MDTHQDRISEILFEAAKLPDCLTKFDLLEEAIRLADLHQDIQLGFHTRQAFLRVARNLLRGDQMAIAFTWCLHQYDQRPDLFAGRDLLDDYAELIGQLANFDSITRAQLDSMLEDLTERRIREGRSLAPVWMMKREMAPDLGDKEFSHEAIRQLKRLNHTESELTSVNLFYHAVFVGDDDEALRIADSEWFCRGGKLPSSYKWYRALLLLLKRGRVDEHRKWQQRAYSMVHIHDTFYWEFGTVVASLALSGRIDDAVKMAGKCQRAIHEFTDPLTRLHFHLNLLVLFERLYILGQESVLIRFRDGVPGRMPSGRYVVKAVRDWMYQEAAALALRFDTRNGTTYYADQLQQRANWQEFALPVL